MIQFQIIDKLSLSSEAMPIGSSGKTQDLLGLVEYPQ